MAPAPPALCPPYELPQCLGTPKSARSHQDGDPGEGAAPCPWCPAWIPSSYPARRDMVLSPGHIQRSEPLPTTASVIAGGPGDTGSELGSEFGSEPGAI